MAISQDQFRAIISGRRRDARARVARPLLRLASLGYGTAVRTRNALYDLNVLQVHRVDAAVFCVGNLTTGGTGKTPFVAWLVKYLQGKGLRVAILTRGYKSNVRATHASPLPDHADEPAELAAACPGAPIIVNPDRVAGAEEAITMCETANGRTGERANAGTSPIPRFAHSPIPASDQRSSSGDGPLVLVMDDGFQHRRLARNLDILTIDATEPFGYGRLLPAGLLREPLGGLRRAHAVVLTRCDQVAAEALGRIESTIRNINPSLVIARSSHAPSAVRRADGSESGPAELKNKATFAFCGIGNPDGFLRTLESCGCRIVGKRILDDHQAYSDALLADLHAQAKASGAELLLTTQKDWTKIRPLNLPSPPPALAYLVIELGLAGGAETLTALIDGTLAGRMASR